MSGDRTIAATLRKKLRLPVMAAPMYIASSPELVIAQCKAGIVGSIPALNARTPAQFDEWLAQIQEALVGCDVPYAVNVVAHRTNDRLEADLDAVIRHKVPIVALALAARSDFIDPIHGYGGLVFNDVATNRQARKCAELGVDGIVAVATGAGGHTGSVSAFALVAEVREWWEGLLALGGCIADGRGILAAQILGADLAYIGSPFLATEEANTQPAFKQMVVESTSEDVVLTNCFTGVNALFLKQSLIANGLDPKSLVRAVGEGINVSGGGSNSKAWRDIWSAGQGIGAVKTIRPTGEYIGWLVDDYARAKKTAARLF